MAWQARIHHGKSASWLFVRGSSLRYKYQLCSPGSEGVLEEEAIECLLRNVYLQGRKYARLLVYPTRGLLKVLEIKRIQAEGLHNDSQRILGSSTLFNRSVISLQVFIHNAHPHTPRKTRNRDEMKERVSRINISEISASDFILKVCFTVALFITRHCWPR